MHFSFPIALAGLALLILPVAIHLLVRRRATPRDFPSLRFLQATRSHQWLPRRVQQPLLLAFRLLALALMIVGLAHPLLSGAASGGKLSILLLDASLSMRAGNRTDAVREQARAVIDRLGANDRLAVIAFDANARTLAAPTGDRAVLLNAVAGYQPGYGSADYMRAVRVAAQVLETSREHGGEVDIISDFQASGLRDEDGLASELIATGVHLVPLPVGAPIRRNTHWVDVRVERAAAGPKLSATEVLSEDGGVTATPRSWLLNSPAGNQPELVWKTEANGQITGRLRSAGGDDLSADNEFTFALSPARKGGTLLIADQTDATVYLRAALTSVTTDGADESVLEPEVRSALPDAGPLDQYALVTMVLHRDPDPATVSELVSFARRGGAVWLCAGADLNTVAWDQLALDQREGAPSLPGLSRVGQGASLRLGVTDAGAASVSGLLPGDRVSLHAVPVSTSFAITPPANGQVEMRWSNGTPAMVQSKVGSGWIILLGTSPERAASGLGLSAIFPQLTASITAAADEAIPLLSYAIGGPVPDRFAEGRAVEIIGPGGDLERASRTDLVRDPGAVFSEPGLYLVSSGGRSEFFAFNPATAESESALADPDLVKKVFAHAGSASSSQRATPDAVRPESVWWRNLLVLALAFFVFELFVSLHRVSRRVDRPVAPESLSI